ncbi:uncharacterized protein LOC113320175 [Papaver somniferum]|uniref:uncharacterized protein LOC113320175 n=1 Tax=Papaver somniferum TaxID=3469 RepID=UPI000E6FDC36|nr:uncharacterized protein LOC113320175 [Papaver somniferum]
MQTILDADMESNTSPDNSERNAASSTNYLAYGLDVAEEGSFSSVERPSGLDMLRMTYTDSESDSENGSYPDHEGAANGLETLQMNYGGPWTDTDLHDVLYLEFLDILDTG